MLIHTFRLPADLVPHPRFGATVSQSGHRVSHEEIVKSSWRHGGFLATVFPESAMRADISRQKDSVIPLQYYVDRLVTCRECARPFLFFAREQQHWYEELGFTLDADCVRCPECRKARHRIRRRFQRFSDLIGKDDRSDAELSTLVEDAVFLSRAGILRDEQKLRRLKNLALARIPEEPATREILGRLGEISGRAPTDPDGAEIPAAGPSVSTRPEIDVLALTWEPTYEMWYRNTRDMLDTGISPGQIRAQFSILTQHSGLGGDFGRMASQVREAVEDALAGRPIRDTPPP